MIQKEIKKIDKMNKDQMLELIRLIEIIQRKSIQQIIIEYYENANEYQLIEKELIDNKIALIKSKTTKYLNIEINENVTAYTYDTEIKVYHKTIINKEAIKTILKNIEEKEIFIKEKYRRKKITREDINRINNDFEIVIKTK